MFKWLFKKKGCAKHMNNKLEVIGIDHGWSMMKTISQVYVSLDNQRRKETISVFIYIIRLERKRKQAAKRYVGWNKGRGKECICK